MVGPGDDSSTDMGPLITREHCERVAGYVAAGAEAAAHVVVDGRALKFDGVGFYFGPTLTDQVRPEVKATNRLQTVNDLARVPHYRVLSTALEAPTATVLIRGSALRGGRIRRRCFGGSGLLRSRRPVRRR